ncbi:MAG TPA: type II toxin-antitoxin system VapB family antitoxin [Stellaceae bacterium]|nr:type II toxin-antitoxin system VapB family antitoxin [Stellaceae bacterium]
MRTNIDIDDALMRKAMKASGLTTKRATVEAALRLLVRLHEQEKILKLGGKIKWHGDLEQSRLDRNAQ